MTTQIDRDIHHGDVDSGETLGQKGVPAVNIYSYFNPVFCFVTLLLLTDYPMMRMCTCDDWDARPSLLLTDNKARVVASEPVLTSCCTYQGTYNNL